MILFITLMTLLAGIVDGMLLHSFYDGRKEGGWAFISILAGLNVAGMILLYYVIKFIL